MWIRTLRWSLVVLVAAAVAWTAGRAWSISFGLGQSKEELKLKYELTVSDHGTGRVTVVLTLADAGRLKPVNAMELVIPMEEGSGSVDLSVPLATREVEGKREARVHLKKEWAKRAQIWLTTSTLDGKQLLMGGYYHVIPIAKYIKNAPAAAAKPAAEPAAGASPATERKKD
jgi:hypothetical protein